MKKTYISPSIEVVKVDAANIIATSVMSISEDTVDTSTYQLGREDNSASSIWEQGW